MWRSFCIPAGLLLACAALAVPAPDQLKDWGNPVDPDRDCKIRRDGGVLSIEMPGAEHDYDPARKQFNAPRFLREIEGEFDLQVRIRIDCSPSTQSTLTDQPACVSAGFLMIFPDTYPHECVCNRLDYGVVLQRIGIDGFPAKPKPLLPHSGREKESRQGIGQDGCVLCKDWRFEVNVARNLQPIIDRDQVKQVCLILFDRGWPHWPMPKKADYAYLRMEHRLYFP